MGSSAPYLLTPEADEAWVSYLRRASRVYGEPMWFVAQRFGTVEPGQRRFAPEFMMEPSEVARAAFSATPGVLEDMFLSRYEDVYGGAWRTDGLRKFALAEWLHVGASPVCPGCLGEGSGYWRLSWRVPFVFMCLEHRTLLSDACPACGSPHGSGGRDGSAGPRFVDFSGDTRACMNPADGVAQPDRARAKLPCAHDLTSIAPVPLDVDAALDAQRLILAVLNAQEEPLVAGALVSRRAWFYDLRTLVAWLIYVGPASLADTFPATIRDAWSAMCEERDAAVEQRRGVKGSLDHSFTRTPTPALMAVAATHAVKVMRAPDEAVFVDRVGELANVAHGACSRRSRAMCARPHNSAPFRLAVHEVTIAPKMVQAFLATHPLRGAGAATPVTIDVARVRSGLRFLEGTVEFGAVLPAFELMVRWFRSPLAREWRDAIAPGDPVTIGSMVLRLVNESSRLGHARDLARLVVEIATDSQPSVVKRPLAPSKTAQRSDLRFLPPAWPVHGFREAFSEAFEGLRVSEIDARVTTSCLVAAAATGTEPTSEFVLDALGVEDPSTRATVAWLVQLLSGRGACDALLPQFEAAAERAIAAGIDYRDRHRCFADLHRIDPTDWATIAARTGVNPGYRGGRETYAAVYVWEQFCAGDWRTAPAITTQSRRVKSSADVYRTFLKQAPEALLQELKAYGAFLLAGGQHGHYGSRSGPLSASGAGYEPRHVPTLFFADVYASTFAPYVAPFDIEATTARAALSMMLLEKVIAMPRDRLGELLELPPRFVSGGVSRALQLLRASPQADALAADMDAFAQRLSADHGRVDYRARRDALRDLVDIPTRDWAEIVAAAGITPGKPGGRSMHAAAWLWAELTQSHPKWSPAFRASGRPIGNLMAVLATVQARYVPRLRAPLMAYGHEVLGRAA